MDRGEGQSLRALRSCFSIMVGPTKCSISIRYNDISFLEISPYPKIFRVDQCRGHIVSALKEVPLVAKPFFCLEEFVIMRVYCISY